MMELLIRASVIAHWRRCSDRNFLVVLMNLGVLPFALICPRANVEASKVKF